jgi:hypothetical protein
MKTRAGIHSRVSFLSSASRPVVIRSVRSSQATPARSLKRAQLLAFRRTALAPAYIPELTTFTSSSSSPLSPGKLGCRAPCATCSPQCRPHTRTRASSWHVPAASACGDLPLAVRRAAGSSRTRGRQRRRRACARAGPQASAPRYGGAAPRTRACLVPLPVRRTSAGADAERAGCGRDDFAACGLEESILTSAQVALVSWFVFPYEAPYPSRLATKTNACMYLSIPSLGLDNIHAAPVLYSIMSYVLHADADYLRQSHHSFAAYSTCHNHEKIPVGENVCAAQARPTRLSGRHSRSWCVPLNRSGEAAMHHVGFCCPTSRMTRITSVGLHRQRLRELTHAPSNCLLVDTDVTVR